MPASGVTQPGPLLLTAVLSGKVTHFCDSCPSHKRRPTSSGHNVTMRLSLLNYVISLLEGYLFTVIHYILIHWIFTGCSGTHTHTHTHYQSIEFCCTFHFHSRARCLVAVLVSCNIDMTVYITDRRLGLFIGGSALSLCSHVFCLVGERQWNTFPTAATVTCSFKHGLITSKIKPISTI